MKTLNLRTILMTILGIRTDLYKKFHCKFAIFDINRMNNLGKFYLLEEKLSTQMGKRHSSCGWKKASKGTWDWNDELEAWEMAFWSDFDWLINFYWWMSFRDWPFIKNLGWKIYEPKRLRNYIKQYMCYSTWKIYR